MHRFPQTPEDIAKAIVELDYKFITIQNMSELRNLFPPKSYEEEVMPTALTSSSFCFCFCFCFCWRITERRPLLCRKQSFWHTKAIPRTWPTLKGSSTPYRSPFLLLSSRTEKSPAYPFLSSSKCPASERKSAFSSSLRNPARSSRSVRRCAPPPPRPRTRDQQRSSLGACAQSANIVKTALEELRSNRLRKVLEVRLEAPAPAPAPRPETYLIQMHLSIDLTHT